MTKNEDCYFFIDLTKEVPEEERVVSVLCLKCRNEHFPNIGWFWNGSSGYGPWTYKCSECQHIIHEGKKST